MDSFFGIGAPELIVILVLAGIVMGPQRIRQVALWLGKTTAQLQSISRGFVRQLNAELDTVDQGGELKSAMKEVQELRRQVGDLRREITSSALGTVQESQKAVQETRQWVQQSIKPPELGVPDETASASENKLTPPANLPNPLHIPDDPE